MSRTQTITAQIEKFTTPQEFDVAAETHLTLVLIATESAEYQANVHLLGEGASADIFGLVLGRNAHTIQINTLQDHRAPNTTSNLLIKSALTGRSQFNYQGVINVNPQAQHTNAYQRNENLMLSPEAKAESKPALEILANDVRCTHSATIGKIDPEQLFYLISRGISEKEAVKLIASGFFTSVFEKISAAAVEKQFMQQVHASI